jgi:hypothetical protein
LSESELVFAVVPAFLVLFESALSEKKQEHKHGGNYRAEKCHDGHEPDHLFARTQIEDSAEPTAGETLFSEP